MPANIYYGSQPVDIAHRRRERIADSLDQIRSIVASEPMSRSNLHRIRDVLVDLAMDQALFSLDDFPPPASGESAAYRLAQDGDDGMALYLQTAMPGNSTPPHNHGTWAVVAGVSGEEANLIYDRQEVEDNADLARVTPRETVMLARGTAVCFLPDDVHSIHGLSLAVHLHLYGKPFEQMTDRVLYDPVTGESTPYLAHAGIQERR